LLFESFRGEGIYETLRWGKGDINNQFNLGEKCKNRSDIKVGKGGREQRPKGNENNRW
jgi:hypothetical protein